MPPKTPKGIAQRSRIIDGFGKNPGDGRAGDQEPHTGRFAAAGLAFKKFGGGDSLGGGLAHKVENDAAVAREEHPSHSCDEHKQRIVKSDEH
jgi:hypothetical protein